MSKKTFKVEVTTEYTIEVDYDNNIVKEYANDDELIGDLASYRFSVLPVINNGVEIKNVETIDWSFDDGM